MRKDSVKDDTSDQNSELPETSNQTGRVVCEEMKDVASSENRKKIWSSDALKEAMSPTCEELDYRREKSMVLNPVEKYSKLFKCTKCQKNLKFSIQKNKKVPVHTCLGVLMCEECRSYYEDGEFSLDSDGEDKYCRWCGEGGTIFTCSKCICGFCANCIKRHFSLKFLKNVQKDENWLCFFCNPKPLWLQRYICSLATQLTEEADASPKQAQTGNSRSKRKRVYNSSSSDETDLEGSKSPLKKYKLTSTPLKILLKDIEKKSSKDVETGVLSELQKLLKLSEYQMSFGVTWCQDTSKKLSQSTYTLTEEGFLDECKKIKWFLSVLSTYLLQFSNSVDSIERGLCRDDGKNSSSGTTEKNESPYTTILQFLDFITNQVKTFVQKGIDFPEILEASVYDDGRVIGLKKKTSLKNKKVDPPPTELELGKEDSDSNESKEEDIEDDGSKAEGSLEAESDHNNETTLVESGDGSIPHTKHKGNNTEGLDSAQEIQKLLSILENA